MAWPLHDWSGLCTATAEWTAPQTAVTAFADTSVLIDYLRGHALAAKVLENHRAAGPLHASEITRLEILAGMRPGEESPTRSLLSALIWHPVDTAVAEQAGALGRQWLPSHHTIDSADLAIAATVQLTGLALLTKNVRHFPMFPRLRPPY
ncbi:MAG: type II toxin-antitoxin system VapC family toxin [Chloroflexi bacterium]|nr:MAG: type II toxin-antitoxin system VapC family toxin [Chloroflexota bacterium]